MPYELKPLSCDPAKLTGLSEKLIVSHWENNYGGAVKRLNAIEQRLATPEALRGFDRDGYDHAPEVSTPDRLVFRRRA